MTRVLALTVRPVEGPDTRYRIMQYLPLLTQEGFTVEHRHLLSSTFYRRQQRKELSFFDVFRYSAAVLKRAWHLLRHHHDYDTIWISRELMPLGPPIMERLLFSRFSGKVIMDFDDALFQADPLGGFMHRHIRDFNKYTYIAPRCTAIVCGNMFLADYFKQFCPNTVIISTCVDHNRYAAIPRIPSPAGRVRVGWIGTATNRGHVELLQKPIEALARRVDFEFISVGLSEPLAWNIPHIRNLSWSLAHELEYFGNFDIGVMPLEDSIFTRGKCAFKLIQYLAAGLPVVASPVGANCEVVEHGVHGFLADTDKEWEQSLERLILDADLRKRMGEAGKQRIYEQYSLHRCGPQYAALLRGYL